MSRLLKTSMALTFLQRLRPRRNLVLCCLLLTSYQSTEAANFCYLPHSSNVAYGEVVSLPTGKPQAVFKYGSDENQYAELWLPDSDSSKVIHPLIVFVHGGCWLAEYDIKHSWALATSLANSGYAVWSIEYRRSGQQGGGWPGSFDDVIAAIQHLDGENLLSRYRVDASRIALAGHSAGGHLALLAGSDLGTSKLKQQGSPEIIAVYGLAAITDIASYSRGENSCQSATDHFMGGSLDEKPEAYKQANPVNHRLHPQSLLIHGTDDAIVPMSQATFKSAEYALVSDAGHFDHIHPGTVAHKKLLQQLAKTFK